MSDEAEKQPTDESSNEETRRAALAKIALYGAYTAPLMLGMMTAAKAQQASGGIIQNPD